MRKRKPLSELTLMDDYMFYAVMSEKVLLKVLLESILGIKIEYLEYVGRQETLKQGYESKGIRLDVYVIDSNGVSYDIEVQVEDKKDLPKRTRYYHGSIDISLLPPGKNYNDLGPSLVIFITNFDPFGLARYIYTFQNRCDQERSLCLGDGAKSVFVNTKGKRGKISRQLRQIIRYLNAGEVSDGYTRQLDGAVNSVKGSEERRLEYMRIYTYEDELRAEGRAEGRIEGRAEGRAEGRIEGEIKGRVKTYNEMGMNADEIIKKIGSIFSMSETEAAEHVEDVLALQPA